jgi:peptidoglycan/LPS O-acetylase OafA/YrhL
MTVTDEYRASQEMEKKPLFDEMSLASDFESEADSEATLHSNFSPSPSLKPAQFFDNVQPYIRSCRIQSWTTTLGRIGFALLPSFVQNQINKDEDQKPEKLHPTAYLDGMRGLAALFVFFCHMSYGSFRLTKGYGYVWEDGTVNNYILQLPFLRLLFSGPPMVCIFFVISGYALSLKPLKLMRSHSWAEMSITMSSSIFRRGMRLFIPTTISTFMVLLLVQYNYYETNRGFAASDHYFPNIKEHHMWQADTFYEQFLDWAWRMFEFVHIWSFDQFGGSTGYDLHLWTIPLEFRASMLLFLLQMGLARVRTSIRWCCLIMFCWFSLRNQRWEMILFVSGLLLAELDLIRIARRRSQSLSHASSPLPTYTNILSEKARGVTKNSEVRKYSWYFVAVLALYFMSTPDEEAAETPGWQYLATWVPEWLDDKYRFWQGIGSIMFVLATNFSPTLQRPFNTAFVQYFGKISYAIYLMHGPVLHTAGYSIMRWAWSVTGSTTEGQYAFGFILSAVFIVPLTVWAADLFWRFVDAPVVRFAKWVETQCVKED